MKIKLSIKQKIYLGFFILLFIFFMGAIISAVVLLQNKRKIIDIAQNIDPSLQTINEFNMLITESKMLTTNWVYLQSNQVDKDSLNVLHTKKYPALKEKLTKQKATWKDVNTSKMVDSVFANFEKLLTVEQGIMGQLVSFENYEDPMIKIEAEGQIENEVLSRSQTLSELLRKIIIVKQNEKNTYQDNLQASTNFLTFSIITLSVFLIIIGVLISLFMVRSIIIPIKGIQRMVNSLGRGELNNLEMEIGKDEIGEMALAVQNLTNGLRNTANFSNNIGNGIFESDYRPLSDKDVLGVSLIGMRDNLKKVSEEDAQRKWASEGLAKFADILRDTNKEVKVIANDIISHLVKYVKANQGGIFIVNDDDEKDIYIELMACYAYDRKKYLTKRLELGEGLVGQSIVDKDIIFITDIPESYLSITSGLGESAPKCIVIVPLKMNELVFGAIELASFDEIQSFEIDFVAKLAESIASTISSAKVNNKTKILLEQLQEQTEQMRSQEEEMRQNMEELVATQEQMSRSAYNEPHQNTIEINTSRTYAKEIGIFK